MTIIYLDIYCLTAICDDYKNLAQIQTEVCARIHSRISIHQLSERLRALAKEGLATAYDSSNTEPRYVPIADLEGDLTAKWFAVTDKGRKIVILNSSV